MTLTNNEIHSEVSDKDQIDLAVDPESEFAVSGDVDTRYLETFLDENTVALNEDYDDHEHNDMTRTWKRLSIVADLAEDIYEFDTDSDSDDDQAGDAAHMTFITRLAAPIAPPPAEGTSGTSAAEVSATFQWLGP